MELTHFKAEIGRTCLPACPLSAPEASAFYYYQRRSNVPSPMNIRNRCDRDNDFDFEVRHLNSAAAPKLIRSHSFQLPCLMLIINITTIGYAFDRFQCVLELRIGKEQRYRYSIWVSPFTPTKVDGRNKNAIFLPFIFISKQIRHFVRRFVAVDFAIFVLTDEKREKKNGFSLARRSHDSYRPFVSKNVLFSWNVCRRWHCSGVVLCLRAPCLSLLKSLSLHYHWSKSVNWTFDAFCLVVVAVLVLRGWVWCDMPAEPKKK